MKGAVKKKFPIKTYTFKEMCDIDIGDPYTEGVMMYGRHELLTAYLQQKGFFKKLLCESDCIYSD